MGDRPSLSMLGWALNEEQGIERYVTRAEAFLSVLSDNFKVILIDDGSTDRTWEVMNRCQGTRPWLQIVQNGHVPGSGYNAKRAISACLCITNCRRHSSDEW
ncbi:MAG TPA: glycosyltransferase [Vicinamibacterales bacterium]|nr:glycosyltransferase [Vicinamibacterales bacterium]